jgi:hypothetical protein
MVAALRVCLPSNRSTLCDPFDGEKAAIMRATRERLFGESHEYR